MSVTISPPMFLQFMDPNNSGSPLVGGKLFTYQAGTSTKQNTWTDSTQSTLNTNPIILDANGACYLWADPTLKYKFVLSPKNDTDPPSSPYRTVDNIESEVTMSLLTQALIGGILYPRTAAEIAAGVTPTNFAYVPGDFRRYGAKGDGSTDDTTALANALLCNQTVFGGGVQYKYPTSQPLKLTSYCTIDGQGCSIIVTADVPAFTNATGASVLYPNVRNLSLLTNVLNMASAAMDLVDVSRGTFQINKIDRNFTNASWGYAIRLRTSVSVCLWNRFLPFEADCVNTGFISIENSNCNQNVFFGPKLINDSAILIPYGIKITLGGDNHFFDADLEASFATTPAGGKAYAVNFNSGTGNKIYGLRTEGYANSALFYGVNYAGAAGDNQVWGHYQTGFGVVGPTYDGLLHGNTYVGSGFAYLPSGSLTALAGECGWDSVSDRFKATTTAGGQRLVVQSPALDDLNMNGHNITGLQAQSSGWGTPTGAAAVLNFPGAGPATLAQCSNAIAAIIEVLRAQGAFGA